MRLVRLVDAGQSGTKLGTFLEALMRKFELPDLLLNLGRSDMQSNYPRFNNWTDEVKEELIAQLLRVADICKESGFTSEDAYKGTAERIREGNPHLIADLGRVISQMRNSLISEIKRLSYLEIAKEDVSIFSNPQPFGAEVWSKFPDAREDFEEAAKCVALDRGTACVMHLTRGMEHVLRAFGVSLNLTFKLGDDWKAMLDAIEQVLTPMPVSQRKDAYRQAHADLGRVKLAWRIPAFHSRWSWTPEQAREVFGSCRAFAQHVATVA